MDEFTGGVARQQRFQHQPRGRSEEFDAFTDRFAQSTFGESIRGNRGTQQIAMGQQKFAIALGAGGLTVADQRKLGICPQSSCSLPRQPGSRCGVGRIDPDEDQA